MSGSWRSGLARLLELHDEADAHYAEGLDHMRRRGFLTELVWICSDYSEMLLERDAAGNREKITELQDEAIAIATEFGMKPLLERVLSQREILKA